MTKKNNLFIEEIGRVVAISGPIIKIEGLPYVYSQEVVKIGKARALIFQFGQEFTQALVNQDMAYALSLEEGIKIKIGEKVERTKEVLKIPVGEELIGKILNPLGKDINSGIIIKTKESREVENLPPDMMSRQEIKDPLETGIKIIDALFPIGRGQRELIIGDRKTGKSTLAIDTILNQEDVICIYASIGQRKTEVARLVKTLREFGALDYSIIITAFSSSSPVLQYLAPFSAMTLAEYFRDKGKDVLVVFDDLTKHAWAWREISLLLERPPGREAYPGDIFYLHARLLERAGKFNKKKGGGSISALPICETRGGDISEYIPTNLISITDGQLYLENDLFQKGIKPAINIGLSVSRIGSKAQRLYMKQVTKGLKPILSQHSELQKLIKLETNISEEAEKNFHRGEILLKIFKQNKHQPVDTINQSILYWAVQQGFFDDLDLKEVKKIESYFYEFIDSLYKTLKRELAKKGWTEKIKIKVRKLIETFKKKNF